MAAKAALKFRFTMVQHVHFQTNFRFEKSTARAENAREIPHFAVEYLMPFQLIVPGKPLVANLTSQRFLASVRFVMPGKSRLGVEFFQANIALVRSFVIVDYHVLAESVSGFVVFVANRTMERLFCNNIE